jgi:hypothetical protein
MRAALTVLALCTVTLGAAACTKDKKADEANAPAAGTPAAPSAASPATPAGLPRRKPGLWEMTMTMQGEDQPPMVTRMCLDAATEAKSSIWGNEMTRDMCSKNEMRRQLDGSWKFSSVCNMGSGGVTRSEGTATGDLTNNYVIRMKSSTSGAELEMMNRDSEFTVASRRIGACEPGQRGGDMIMNGRVIANMNDLPGPGGARDAAKR